MNQRKLRILQVMRAPVGGLFRHVSDLTRALGEMGHEVGLVVDTLANDAQTESALLALAPAARLGIHRFPMPRLLGGGDLTTPFAVRRLARSLEIDILHGHGAKGGFYARLARIGTPALAFYTPHGGVLHFSTDSLSGRVFHRLERALMPRTAAIIFESAYARDTYSKRIASPSCPTQVIHNGLAPAEFTPLPPRPDAADFVFVGELRGLKGIYPLADALREVRRADGTPATLVMAGDGPERAQFERYLADRALSGRVKLLGSKPAREVFPLGRVAVVPSLAESLPYVVMEAAAAHLPVIATRVGGIPEIFGPTADALVPPDDAPALARALQAALDHPEAAQAEMRRRLSHIEAGFSVSTMATAIEALYQAHMGHRAAGLHRT